MSSIRHFLPPLSPRTYDRPIYYPRVPLVPRSPSPRPCFPDSSSIRYEPPPPRSHFADLVERLDEMERESLSHRSSFNAQYIDCKTSPQYLKWVEPGYGWILRGQEEQWMEVRNRGEREREERGSERGRENGNGKRERDIEDEGRVYYQNGNLDLINSAESSRNGDKRRRIEDWSRVRISPSCCSTKPHPHQTYKHRPCPPILTHSAHSPRLRE